MARGRQSETRTAAGRIDDIDRKILAELIRDAGITYARLGARVALSAPATHERVRRLRREGVILSTSVKVDPAAAGKTFLAFVHVNTTGWAKNEALLAIERYPEVEEIHSVAGDTGMILKVRTEDAQALENLLAQVYATPGVVSTCSYVVLSSFLERPMQAEVTQRWPTLSPALPPGLAKTRKRG